VTESLTDRVARLAAHSKQRDKDRRASNRANMPLSAAFIDAFAKVFGKLPYGRFVEGGHTVTWGTDPTGGRKGVPISAEPIRLKRRKK